MPDPSGRLAERLVDAAVRSVEERGWSEVTLRDVAAAGGVTYGAPIARFGDSDGLLAAVAERGFRLLEQELIGAATTEAPPRPPAPPAVTSLGLVYVGFALPRRNLHRAMQHPDLWTPRPAREAPSPSIRRRVERSNEWRAAAEKARNACFTHFVQAVVEGQMGGSVAPGPPGEIARLVTAAAEGFILQTSDPPTAGLERQLEVAGRLLSWVERGIAEHE